MTKSTFLVVVVVLAAYAFHRVLPRVRIPKHMLHQRVETEENFLSEAVAAELLALVKEMEVFPTNVADRKSYKTFRHHIGEAVPAINGSCSHPYLTPYDDTCVLPGRIDVGRHYIRYGGVAALREKYEQIVSRVQSFGKYNFDLDKYPIMQRLFEDGRFQRAAAKICPPDKQVLDPFQLNFILQVPGQTVATHIDAAYFHGASRFHFPQWLLACMVFSGLWKDKFVDQVQVVAYIHEFNPEEVGDSIEDSGVFVYWDKGASKPHKIYPYPRAANMVDGSKTVHAAQVYRKGSKLPVLDKSKNNRLRFQGGENLTEQWLLENEDGAMATYATSDIRISVVYRAKCFASEEERDTYNVDLKIDDKQMELDDVLSKFAADLVRRGKVSSVKAAMDMPRLDYAMLLMDEYIQYPLPPTAKVPWNYCALDIVIPWLKPALAVIC